MDLIFILDKINKKILFILLFFLEGGEEEGKPPPKPGSFITLGGGVKGLKARERSEQGECLLNVLSVYCVFYIKLESNLESSCSKIYILKDSL